MLRWTKYLPIAFLAVSNLATAQSQKLRDVPCEDIALPRCAKVAETILPAPKVGPPHPSLGIPKIKQRPAVKPIEEQREEAYTENTNWEIQRDILLSPGATHTVTLQILEPSLLMAKTRWTGALEPLVLTISRGEQLKGGSSVSTPDRGSTQIKARLIEPGSVRITVANQSDIRASAELIVGILPLSAKR